MRSIKRQTSSKYFSGIHRQAPFVLALSAFAILTGCSDPEVKDAGGLTLTDDNNYKGVAALTIPAVQTTPTADLEICFDEVNANLQCHGMDPLVGIDNVSFVRVLPSLTRAEVIEKLEKDTFVTSDSQFYFAAATDHLTSCVNLSTMQFPLGTFIDLNTHYTADPALTNLLLFSKGTVPGKGAQAMMFLEPTTGSTTTKVAGQSGCGQLQFIADLHTPAPLVVPKAGPWEISWANLKFDGMGNDIRFQNIDEMLVGFYGGMTVADLEAGIFDLESLPTALWRLPVTAGARSGDLSLAVDANLAPFPGFDQPSAGVWIFGLLCDDCQTPAPIVLTVLTPQ